MLLYFKCSVASRTSTLHTSYTSNTSLIFTPNLIWTDPTHPMDPTLARSPTLRRSFERNVIDVDYKFILIRSIKIRLIDEDRLRGFCMATRNVNAWAFGSLHFHLHQTHLNDEHLSACEIWESKRIVHIVSHCIIRMSWMHPNPNVQSWFDEFRTCFVLEGCVEGHWQMRQMMEMTQARQRQAEWRGVLEVLLQLFGSLRARRDSTVHSSKSVFGDSVLTKKNRFEHLEWQVFWRVAQVGFGLTAGGPRCSLKPSILAMVTLKYVEVRWTQ